MSLGAVSGGQSPDTARTAIAGRRIPLVRTPSRRRTGRNGHVRGPVDRAFGDGHVAAREATSARSNSPKTWPGRTACKFFAAAWSLAPGNEFSAPPSAPDERSLTVSRAKALVVLIPAALALLAGVAVASSTSVTITTPKEGQSFSKKKVPQLPVTGDVTFAAANANTSLFYVRRDGCGSAHD